MSTLAISQGNEYNVWQMTCISMENVYLVITHTPSRLNPKQRPGHRILPTEWGELDIFSFLAWILNKLCTWFWTFMQPTSDALAIIFNFLSRLNLYEQFLLELLCKGDATQQWNTRLFTSRVQKHRPWNCKFILLLVMSLGHRWRVTCLATYGETLTAQKVC